MCSQVCVGICSEPITSLSAPRSSWKELDIILNVINIILFTSSLSPPNVFTAVYFLFITNCCFPLKTWPSSRDLCVCVCTHAHLLCASVKLKCQNRNDTGISHFLFVLSVIPVLASVCCVFVLTFAHCVSLWQEGGESSSPHLWRFLLFHLSCSFVVLIITWVLFFLLLKAQYVNFSGMMLVLTAESRRTSAVKTRYRALTIANAIYTNLII